MIDFITKSGSHYRVDLNARTVECVAPPESAFPARRTTSDSLEAPKLNMRFVAFWEVPDERGRVFLRTSEVVFIGEAGEALAL